MNEEHERRMIELHRRHNERYRQYKETHELLQKTIGFDKYKDKESFFEIDRRLKAFDELIKTYDEYDEDVYDYYEVMGLKVHEIIMKVKEQ